MSDQKLVKFVEFLRKSHSASDMEIVKLGNSLGLDLVSFKKLRDSQDEVFTDKIRINALKSMKKKNENKTEKPELFFVGSIDFMIAENEHGQIQYFLLEANGGSSRGLSILTPKQQKIIYDGYLESINLAIDRNNNKDSKVLILIGVPIADGLIHEKAIMISYLREKLEKRNLKIGIYNVVNFDSNFMEDIAFLIADYGELSTKISFKENWIKFNNTNVNILIGDGVARRFKNKKFENLLTNNFNALHTIIINPIYLITDDKSLSYLAKHLVNDELEKYNVAKFLFTKAFNEKKLIQKIKSSVLQYSKPFIIKPHGGSGGAGVMSIFPSEIKNDASKINQIIEESKKEFYDKFMKSRNPFPYTIQEMAKFSLIDWRGGKHAFDIRIYLSQNNGNLIPVGGLARIARGNFINGANKEEFVVNLSGFDGRIEVDRGLGFSKDTSSLLGLNYDHFIDLFCTSSIIFKSIIENYQKIVDFSDWDKIIGPD